MIHRWTGAVMSRHARPLAVARRGVPAPLRGSVLQDGAQQGTVDREDAVVLDEAEFPEFIHDEVHARACRPDHVREGLVWDLRQRAAGMALAIARQRNSARASRCSLELKR